MPPRRLAPPRPCRLALTASAALLVAVSAAAQGEREERQPTFRAEVELVEVPVVVTDGAGAFVAGLQVDEFELYEDGRRQAIESFAAIDLPREAFATSEASAPSGIVTNAHPPGRVYAIVLDDLHIDARRSAAVRELVAGFLRTHVYGNDLVTIVQTGGTTDGVREFTSDRATLIASLESFAGRRLPSPPRGCADPLDLPRAYNVRVATDVLANMTSYLARVRGRKTSLLFVSEGIDYDIYDMMGDRQTEAESVSRRIDEAIRTAVRHNVVVYSIDPRRLFSRTEDDEPDAVVPCRPIDPRGRDLTARTSRLSPLLSPPEDLERARRSLQTLRHIAEQTGGFAATDRNAFDDAFARIVRENTQYYLLGYYPARPGNGRFRRLEVEAKRPGLTVRARKGYFAPAAAPDRPSDARGETGNALASALQSPTPLNGLELRAQALSLATDGSTTEAVVIAEVHGRSLELTKAEGRYSGRLELALLDIGADGRPGRVMEQRFDMRLTPGEHDRVRKTAVRAIWRVALSPGAHHLRLAAHDAHSGRSGSLALDITIPDAHPKQPTLGGVLLTSESARLALTPRPDDALGSLLAGPPTVGGSYLAAETLSGLVQVLGAGADAGLHVRAFVTKAAETADSGAGASARAAPVVEAQVTAAQIGGAPVYRFSVPLRRFAPGRYALSVELANRDGTLFDARPRIFDVVADAAAGDIVAADAVVVIAHGPTSERTAAGEVVIRDADAWRRLWRALPTRQPCPEVDFDRFMVVGVFLGQRSGARVQAEIAPACGASPHAWW